MLKTLATTFALALFAAPALGGQPNTYQVTGPVLEVRDDVIVVQKGKEKWEIAKGADTKVTGELKVGSKVTVEYRMTAAAVEVKGGGKAGKDAGKDAAGKEAAKPEAAKPAK